MRVGIQVPALFPFPGMYHLPVDKEQILGRISQEQIFERYMHQKVRFDVLFRSPLRNDKNPTCGFRYARSGILYMKDFGGHFWGNCFDLVMKMHNISFNDALQMIASDFNLSSYKYGSVQKIQIDSIAHTSTPSVIQIRVRNYTKKDLEYWKAHGITAKILRIFNVYPCENAFINGKVIYRHLEKDPCYAYRYGEGEYKLYFPLRPHDGNGSRFFTNTSRIQGYEQLPETGNLLVITKSYKDVMLLRAYSIYAIAPASESTGIGEEILSEMKARFNRIVVVYDFDYAGVKFANRLRKQIGCKALFLTNGRFGTKDYGAKDPTDYYKAKGAEAFSELLRQTIRYVTKKHRDTQLHTSGNSQQ